MSYRKYPIFFITVLLHTIALGQEDTEEQNVFYDFSAELSTDHTYYIEEGLYTNQQRYFASIAFEPEFSMDWNDGNERLVGNLFGRLNTHDENRTHWDIRELYYQLLQNNWELSIGLKEIYWGTTESIHLVNVINQTDFVESFDGEKKLGQPMVHFTYLANFGNFDLFAMPYHRQRTFPDEEGRFRFPLVIEDNDIIYESGAEEYRLDWAVRWSHSFGVFDVGVSHFWGNNREPLFTIDNVGKLRQFYEVMHQTGIDGQATINSWLLKLEATRRETTSDTFIAFDAGFEYTFGNVNGKGLDIGVLTEYLYDDRGNRTTTGFQNDLFFGSRIALNDNEDTSILLGGIVDLENSGKLYSIEAERRFFNNWKANLEVRALSDFDQTELFYAFRQDTFIKLTLGYFF